MEKAIKKAIEGGYTQQWELTHIGLEKGNEIAHFKEYDGDGYFKHRKNVYAILLDPLFWQALGKQQGWDKMDEQMQRQYTKSGGGKIGVIMMRYVYHWHKFIDHLAEGKDIESFFAELLK